MKSCKDSSLPLIVLRSYTRKIQHHIAMAEVRTKVPFTKLKVLSFRLWSDTRLDRKLRCSTASVEIVSPSIVLEREHAGHKG